MPSAISPPSRTWIARLSGPTISSTRTFSARIPCCSWRANGCRDQAVPPCQHRRGFWQPGAQGLSPRPHPTVRTARTPAARLRPTISCAPSTPTYGLPVTVSNCSNNYGPLQFPEKLIPLIILNALEGKPLPVYGDGRNVRDWLFVRDHCTAVWRILQDGQDGATYNVGGRNELEKSGRRPWHLRFGGRVGRPMAGRQAAARPRHLRSRTAPATTGGTR